MRRILLALLLLCPLTIFGQAWSGVLAPSRATDWTSAGIPGGIPSGSWTQCGSTVSASGSSGSPTSPSSLNSLIASCSTPVASCNGSSGKYVLLGSGDFWFSGTVYIKNDNCVVLRGAGPTNTKLHFTAANGCANGNGSCLLSAAGPSGNYAGSPGSVVNWTSGYTQGAATINLSDGSLIHANQTMIMLDQCDTGFSGAPCSGSATNNNNYFNCQNPWQSASVGCSYGGPSGASRPNRGQIEAVEAVSCVTGGISGCGQSGPTVVTITPGLHHANWSSGQSPQAWFVEPSKFVGFENLQVIGSNLPYASVGAGIGFEGTSYSWIKNVTVNSLPNKSVYMAQAANHMQFESFYIYNSGQGLNNDTSAFNYFGSNGLIANGILHNFLIGFILNGPASGNVFAYNYCVNPNSEGGTLFPCFDTHSNGIDYNLYEGNVGPKADADQSHGTALMNTHYRNFYTGWKSCANGFCGGSPNIDTNAYALAAVSNFRYWNDVGNILGTPGISTTYTYCGIVGASGGACNAAGSNWYVPTNPNGIIYSLGAGNPNTPPGVAGGPINYDANVATTTLRYFNWDAVNGSTQTNSGEVPTGISVFPAITPSGTYSASFVFSARPSWYSSSIPFPAMGPDVTSGNVGQCTGTANTAGEFALLPAIAGQCTGTSLTTGWGGHVNAIPALAAWFANGGNADGTNGLLAFDAATWYSSGTPQVATPTFSPAPGTYSSTQSVTLATTTGGATICYTTDGSTPTASTPGTCSHGTTYSGAISVSSTTTINAIGTLSANLNSSMASGTYTIVTQAATPVFTPGTGSYTSGTSVTISTASSGCSGFIYWSSVDNPPTTGDNNSTGFNILTNATIFAKVIGCSGFADSAVGSATYTVTSPVVATPTFSPAPGTYGSSQSVTLTTTTPSAVICYTTNGSTPTATTAGTCDGSPTQTYSGPIAVSSTTTIKAIGTLASFTNSSAATGAYTINTQAATPVFTPGTGSYALGTTVNMASSSSGCSAFIYWSSVDNPPTTGDNHGTSFTILTEPTTIFAKVIGCSGFTDSAVGSATYTINASPVPPSLTGVTMRMTF